MGGEKSPRYCQIKKVFFGKKREAERKSYWHLHEETVEREPQRECNHYLYGAAGKPREGSEEGVIS